MIDWKPLQAVAVEEGEAVLAYNGVHIFDTKFRWAMADPKMVKNPVTHIAKYEVPYPQKRTQHITSEFEEKLRRKGKTVANT